MNEQLNMASLDRCIRASIAEDGEDLTTQRLGIDSIAATASIVAKEQGILCGVDVARRVFEIVNDEVGFQIASKLKDGAKVCDGDQIATLRGRAASILKAERVALNFMQRLSGVATLTRKFVDAVEGTKTTILDTRKTTPGLRDLEKYAVRVGGAQNHRMNLAAAILIKENHIACVGGIESALQELQQSHSRAKEEVIVETRNLQEVEIALNYPITRIMLDNMAIDTIRAAIELTSGKVPLEVSGGVTLENVREIAELNVDYISVGALTHSARAFDFSLKFQSKTG